MEIKRMIIKEGKYNGIYYPGKELEKAYKSFIGVPITTDFSMKIEDMFGTVTDSKYNKKSKSITCTLNIKDKRIIEKINKKLIKSFIPSLTCNIEKEGNKIVAKDIEFESVSNGISGFSK